MKRVRTHTVRGRYIQIVCLLVITILVILSFFSWRTFQVTVESRGKTYMESAVHMLASQMDQEYQHVLQISQHMTSIGVVGKKVNEILQSKNMYDLGEAKREMTGSLQTVTAIGKQVELALYYEPNTQEIFATTYPPISTFSLTEGINTVRQTRSISFHAVHKSQSRFSDYPVLSVSWPDHFSAGQDLIIYVEVRTSMSELLKEINLNAGSAYSLIQMSNKGEICYCSDPAFLQGSDLETVYLSEENFGTSDHLVWCRNRSQSGFDYVLVITKTSFYTSVLQWLDYLIIGVLMALVLMGGAILLFNRKILHKLQFIVEAVNAVQRPELIMTQQRTGLAEYDNLMNRFEILLAYARQLIEEVKSQEEEKSKLELETLYYQINPHFLMNSLNSLYWLARLNEQKEISNYVHHLMELLNYSLGRIGEGPTLRRETEILKDYIALEQMKRSFFVTYDIEEGSYLDAPAPRLFLQPVVENAISHGLDTDGHLSIAVHPDENGAILIIEDDGCGIEQEQLKQLRSMELIRQNGGIGLRYTVSMLKQFYGDNCSIRLENRETGGTRVTMRLGMWKEGFHDPGSDH